MHLNLSRQHSDSVELHYFITKPQYQAQLTSQILTNLRHLYKVHKHNCTQNNKFIQNSSITHELSLQGHQKNVGRKNKMNIQGR